MKISEQRKLGEQRRILSQTPAWFICQSEALCKFVRANEDTPFWCMCDDAKLCSCALNTRNNKLLSDGDFEYLKTRIERYKIRKIKERLKR